LLKLVPALILLAAAAPGGAQGTPSGLQVAATDDIAKATSSCMAAVGPNGTDESVLLAQGWAKGTLTSKGKTVDASLNIYGRKSGNVVVMTAPGTGASGLCTVTARVAGAGAHDAVRAALSASLAKQPFKTTASETFWMVGRTAVQLAPTGNSARPSIRVSVLHVAEKSK
jgi:hypothetical protein